MKPINIVWGLCVLVAVIALAVGGQRFAPADQAPAAKAGGKKACDVDAPKHLHAAAKKWCGDGLFSKVAVTGDDKNVIAVMTFTPDGAQTWEAQSSPVIAEFRNLTDQMAADAEGKDVSIDLHDAADRRVGACARAKSANAASCGKQG